MQTKRTAAETMENLVAGQEKALARIYGSVEEIPERTRMNITGCANLKDNPELSEVAPHHGEFEAYGFSIKRVDVDQLRNIYVRRIQ